MANYSIIERKTYNFTHFPIFHSHFGSQIGINSDDAFLHKKEINIISIISCFEKLLFFRNSVSYLHKFQNNVRY